MAVKELVPENLDVVPETSSGNPSSSTGSPPKEMQETWRSWMLQMMILFLVMVMWNTDNNALPAVYAEIARRFHTTPGGLSNLGLVKGVFESIFALPSGFLADRLPRPALIFMGSVVWGAGLIACAFAPDLGWMIFFRAVNGVGLGIVQPLLFSLVADKSSVYGRGKAFGFLLCTGNLGQTAFTAFATSIADVPIGPIAGWQFAMTVIAVLSALVGVLVVLFVTDVPRDEQRSMLQIVIQETPRLKKIICIPTFLVIIGQGIFGTAPWFAFTYLTMWLELNCFSNTRAATIRAFFDVGTALSSMLGGILLDFIFRRFPDHGPPAISQTSVFLSIPLFALIFFGLGEGSSEDGGVMAVYCVVFLVTGTLIGWNMVMNNKMFSDVVPSESFTYIYALDRAFEGTLGAFGQPAVGWLTDQVFGFDSSANVHECSPPDAYSLAQGVFTVCAVGFSLCFIFYSIAHCTYPKDRRRVLAQQVEGKQEMPAVI